MRSLGALEAQVMAVLWSGDHATVTVREVLVVLHAESGTKKHAYTTIMTVLDNLYRKGLVNRQRDGRSFRYEAALTREQYTAELLDEVLSTATDTRGTLMHFVESMSDREVDELRHALEAARESEET